MPLDQILQSPLTWTVGGAVVVLLLAKFYYSPQPIAKAAPSLSRHFLDELDAGGVKAAAEVRRAVAASVLADLMKPNDPK